METEALLLEVELIVALEYAKCCIEDVRELGEEKPPPYPPP